MTEHYTVMVDGDGNRLALPEEHAFIYLAPPAFKQGRAHFDRAVAAEADAVWRDAVEAGWTNV